MNKQFLSENTLLLISDIFDFYKAFHSKSYDNFYIPDNSKYSLLNYFVININ